MTFIFVIPLLISIFEWSTCSAVPLTKGLVIYPPYVDLDDDPCSLLTEWNLPKNVYVRPKQAFPGKCVGSVYGISFSLPQPTRQLYGEAFEDSVIDPDRYAGQFNLLFTCRGRVGAPPATGLYSWLYKYRSNGILKSYSYQTTMSWDTEGKMVFQPVERRSGNITCLIYDQLKGDYIPVRTWRLKFVQGNHDPGTVDIFRCSELNYRPTLTYNKPINVSVTSYRFNFVAFCPVVTCLETASQNFYNVSYGAIYQFCTTDPADCASYPTCSMEPIGEDSSPFSYTCSSTANRGYSAQVTIATKRGVRFTNDEHFRVVTAKEDDNITLQCDVDPKTTDGISVPRWEQNVNGEYQSVSGTEFIENSNPTTGISYLIIVKAKGKHQGNYRCVMQQNQRVISNGLPIYGYYFVVVNEKVECLTFDKDASNKQIAMSNPSLLTLGLDQRPDSLPGVFIKCFGVDALLCPGTTDVCQPVAILHRDGIPLAMSNISNDYIAIKTTKTNLAPLGISLSFNTSSAVFNRTKGTYFIKLEYGPPVNQRVDIPFAIKTVDSYGGSSGGGAYGLDSQAVRGVNSGKSIFINIQNLATDLILFYLLTSLPQL